MANRNDRCNDEGIFEYMSSDRRMVCENDFMALVSYPNRLHGSGMSAQAAGMVPMGAEAVELSRARAKLDEKG